MITINLAPDRDKRTHKRELCSECNSAIGKLQDDPEIIERAALYVRNGGV